MDRETVLLAGESNTSKSLALVSLAILYPNKKVTILDPDNGLQKLLTELGITAIGGLPNLTIRSLTSNFKQVIDVYREEKAKLQAGDWLCFDMVSRFWDFAQLYFSSEVYGADPSDRLLIFRKEAGRVQFGGFDGMNDWTVIKALHNEKLMDDAVIYSPFNVMATTGVKELVSDKIKSKTSYTGLEAVYASQFGVMPEGEKHNMYRFDTQAVLYRRGDNTFWFRLVRDRGRPVDIHKEFNITGKSFWEVYKQERGIE